MRRERIVINPEGQKAINLAEGKDLKDGKRKDKVPNKELSRDQVNYKKQCVKDELDQATEALHYAQQDLDHYFSSLNIKNPEKRIEAQRAVNALKADVERGKRELSDLNAL